VARGPAPSDRGDAATESCSQTRRRATSRSWRRIDGGGGFLRSAAMTATGIVGGALVFEGIQSMFGRHDAATITGNQAALPGLGETLFE
jgi:hypothetical protein